MLPVMGGPKHRIQKRYLSRVIRRGWPPLPSGRFSGATVQQIYFRPGEMVPAGRPVVTLLPPPNVKIRFFVPEPMLPKVAYGDTRGHTPARKYAARFGAIPRTPLADAIATRSRGTRASRAAPKCLTVA